MLHTIVVITMTFAFFIFVNLAAVLIVPNRASSPLAATVGFFQLLADLAFFAGLGILGYRVIRKLVSRVEGKAVVAQTASPDYQYEETPLNPHNKEWVLIDTKPMPPITDAQIHGAPMLMIQQNFPITPHPSQRYAVTQIQQARERAGYRQPQN